MSAERNGLTRDVWLWLLKEGGFSSSREIAAGLGMPKSEDIGRIAATMCHGKFLVRREKQRLGQFMRYGITPACKVPMNVTLQDLLECGAIALAGEEATQ